MIRFADVDETMKPSVPRRAMATPAAEARADTPTEKRKPGRPKKAPQAGTADA